MKNIIFDIGNVIAYIDIEEVIKDIGKTDENIKFIKENIIDTPEWSRNGLIDIGYINWSEAIDTISDRTNQAPLWCSNRLDFQRGQRVLPLHSILIVSLVC